jgi:ABC-2 type transport system ATP-binding protein
MLSLCAAPPVSAPSRRARRMPPLRAPRYWAATAFAVCAGFAGAVALFSGNGTHRLWGLTAACAYLASVVAVLVWRSRGIDLALLLSASGALITPLFLNAATGRMQPEVAVVVRSARQLVHLHSPYASTATLAAAGDPNAYNPYLPVMSVFGIPRALFGAHVVTDPRVWFAAAFLVATSSTRCACCCGWAQRSSGPAGPAYGRSGRAVFPARSSRRRPARCRPRACSGAPGQARRPVRPHARSVTETLSPSPARRVPLAAAGLRFPAYRSRPGYPPAVAPGSALGPTRDRRAPGETDGAGRAPGRDQKEGIAMIEARGLTKRYGDTVAVDDLSFGVEPGRITGFLGPNGAGKTTTMRLILGLDHPTSGTVTVNGKPFAELAYAMREVGALLDAKAVHGGRSAYNHLLCLAETNNLPSRRVDEVLGLVGLTEVARKRSKGFSLGMGQRLGIAAALLGDPAILMFDEPVNGLDPEGILWIRNLMKALAAEGRTIFVSSHLMSEMENTADHLLVIGRGRLIADCTVPEFIAANSRQSVRVRTPQPAALSRVVAAAGGTVHEDGDGLMVVNGLGVSQVGDLAFENSVRLHELAPAQASLEQAFMELTASSVQFHAGVTAERELQTANAGEVA